MDQSERAHEHECSHTHKFAMELRDLADSFFRSGESVKGRTYLSNAFHCARRAAHCVPFGLEPTRSVMFLSAARMAFQSGYSDSGFEMLGRAWSGNPPPEIHEEILALARENTSGADRKQS